MAFSVTCPLLNTRLLLQRLCLHKSQPRRLILLVVLVAYRCLRLNPCDNALIHDSFLQRLLLAWLVIDWARTWLCSGLDHTEKKKTVQWIDGPDQELWCCLFFQKNIDYYFLWVRSRDTSRSALCSSIRGIYTKPLIASAKSCAIGELCLLDISTILLPDR